MYGPTQTKVSRNLQARRYGIRAYTFEAAYRHPDCMPRDFDVNKEAAGQEYLDFEGNAARPVFDWDECENCTCDVCLEAID
jgi:hypothetical protein